MYQEASILFLGICSQGLHWWLFGVGNHRNSVFVIQNQTKKLVEPINTMDLEHPLRHVEYEELRPLLMRVHEQNRQIAGQIQELKERHEEYLAITENMKDGLVVASQTEVLSINKVPGTVPGTGERLYPKTNQPCKPE